MKSGHFLVEGHLLKESFFSLCFFFLFLFFFTNIPNKKSLFSLTFFIHLTLQQHLWRIQHTQTSERKPLPSLSFPLFFLFVKLYTPSLKKDTHTSQNNSCSLFLTHYEPIRNAGSTQSYHRSIVDPEYHHHQLYSLSSTA